MLSYPPPNASLTQEHPITSARAYFLMLLCVVWMATGLVGHDPWKPDEVSNFGLIYHILQNGDWLIPTLAGEPHLNNPPLFYVTAALFAKLFSPMLTLHDGARLASGLYVTLALLITGLAGRELFGGGRGWAAVIILIGCLGLLVRAHQLVTDLALLAGCAMMLYGFALSLRRAFPAGALLGTGMGIGFMSKGFISPTLFFLIILALLLFPAWRTQSFRNSICIALLFALPWLIFWPLLLYLNAPLLFKEWAWALNLGPWFDLNRPGRFDESFYYLKILPWFAWPALPLAAWTVWQSRKKILHEAAFQLPLVSFVVMLITLSLLPDTKEVYALPILLPLTLLAAAALSSLRRGAANALDWFGIMTFGLAAILMWWGWAGLLFDNGAKITRWLKDYQPGFEPVFQPIPFWIALILTVLWIIMVWRVGRSMRRAVVNWAGGVTLLWVLAMTLWLPWLDSGKSYRNMVAALTKAMPGQYDCIASRYLGDGQKAMLHYFGNILTQPGKERTCKLLLTQGNLSRTDQLQGNWKMLWMGGRQGDKNERYYLYQRTYPSASTVR